MALRLRIDGEAADSAQRVQSRETFTAKLESVTIASSASSPSTPQKGKLQVDSINEGISETAVQAAGAVMRLREREQELLQQSSDRAYGDQTTVREEEAAVLEAEVARITTSATYNGVNVLSGRTLTLDSTANGFNDAIGLASFASETTTSARFSNQTQANATEDLETLKDAVVSVASLVSSYESALDKSKSSGERPQTGFDTFVPSTIRDEEQAQELARKIAATVVSPYATEKQRAKLVELSSASLEEDTVYKLIA